MASYEAEQARLQKLLEEVIGDEDVAPRENNEPSDDDASDHSDIEDLHLEPHQSESEQDISDNEDGESTASSSLSYVGMYFLCRKPEIIFISYFYRQRQEFLLEKTSAKKTKYPNTTRKHYQAFARPVVRIER